MQPIVDQEIATRNGLRAELIVMNNVDNGLLKFKDARAVMTYVSDVDEEVLTKLYVAAPSSQQTAANINKIFVTLGNYRYNVDYLSISWITI